MWGQKIPWYRQWITSTDREDEYWNTGFWKLLKDIPSRVRVPLYVGEGWYDHHLASAIETWKSLSEECRSKSRFLIGAWDHGFHVKLQDLQGEHFENDDILRAFYWFQDFLVEEKKPEPSVDSYIIGADRWFRREKFEIEGQKERRLFIGECQGNGYSLKQENDVQSSMLSWKYDPETPVMTHGAESLLSTKNEQGSLLQPEPGYREDVITCISEAFEEDVTIAGKMQVVLTVSANVEDTAFVAKIMEVRENGKAYNIRTGITTLGYRNQSDRRKSYEPGEKVKIVIDTWDIAWMVKKGSRIRIDFTSSDFPQYSVHSNYAGCWAEQKNIRPALLQVYFGGYDESYLKMPVL